MDRSEHLQWCKDRAIELLDAGQITEALASMASDLGKHPGTQDHIGRVLMFGVDLTSPDRVRDWINGFN